MGCAAPRAAARKRSVLPYVVIGAGGASLVTGTIFGLMATSRKSAAVDEPKQATAADLRDTGRTFATVSNVTFVVGGVLVAAGAVWWLLDGASVKRAVRVGVGPGSLQLGGYL
ncbi:MAG: hypothetical protein NVS3B10_18870 [Polyangiales bacterium]